MRAVSGRRFALALLASGLVGGLTAAAVLLGTHGAGGGNTRTTVVVSRPPFDAAAVYRAAAPGVVDISVHAVTQPTGPVPAGPEESTTTGSGFVVDARGRIATAEHVVKDAVSIRVRFADGTSASADVLGVDRSSDVALLTVQSSGLKLRPLALGSARSLSVGDEVAVIGDPFGFDRSLSTGVVSALDRSVKAPNGYRVEHVIQTDAPLNPGNSGGPLLDRNSRVVGIADQIANGGTGTETYTGVGFAIPIDIVRADLATLAAARHPAGSKPLALKANVLGRVAP